MLLSIKRIFKILPAITMIAAIMTSPVAYAEDTALTLKSVVPANGATNVTNVSNADSANYVNLIRIEFNEEMDPSTLNKSSIVVTNIDTSTVIDYKPVINNGLVYAIDPADLATIEDGLNNTTDAWNAYVGKRFKITVTSDAKKADGRTSLVESTEQITSFKTGYIVRLPYKKGAEIRNVAKNATFDSWDQWGVANNPSSGDINEGKKYNQDPTSIFTETDSTTGINSAYDAVAFSKSTKDATKNFAVINLGQEYAIAGIMLRNRFNGSAYTSEGVNYFVGKENDANSLILSTGRGIGSSLSISTNFYSGWDEAQNHKASKIYINAANTSQRFHLVNKMWIFAYIGGANGVDGIVDSVTPQKGASNVTNIGENATKLIEIKFTEPISAATLNKDTVVVERTYTNGKTGEPVTEEIDYTPVINDGLTYAIDPADLAVLKKDIDTEYVHWGSAMNNRFTVKMKGNLIKKQDSDKYISGSDDGDFTVTDFTTDYFVEIPYVKGKYIKNVAADASVAEGSYSMFTGAKYNEDANSMLTEDDALTGITSDLDCVAFNRSTTEAGATVAVINLDKYYDIAGIMLRGRRNNSAYTSSGTFYYVGEPNNSKKKLIDTGVGIGGDYNTPFAVMTNFTDLDRAKSLRGKQIYINSSPNTAGGQRFHVVNKLWVFAYISDGYTGNAPEYDFKDFEATGSLKDGFEASVEIDRTVAPTLLAAVYNPRGGLVKTIIGEWNIESQKVILNVPPTDRRNSVKIMLWNSVNGIIPLTKPLTEDDILDDSEEESISKEFYVSTSGSDDSNGLSPSSAFRTLERAQEEVRKYNRSMTGDIVVNVLEGTYFLDNPLDITEEDSGFNGYNVIWRGEGRPTISGGRRISGFKPSEKYRGIYELKVDNIERIWNMYVNGEKRYYAKSEYMVRGVEKPASLNTSAYYKAHPNAAQDKYSYYDENTPFGRDGMYISKEDISQYENAEDVICYWNLNWESHIIPIESIEENPYDSSNYIVRMKEGLFDIAVARNAVDKRYPRPEKYFQIGNAMELLDSPGELYYNRKTKMLYYMPTENENLDRSEIIIPELERIMFVGGSDRYNPAKNITFEGFNIAHTAWYNLANGIIAEQGTNNFGLGLGNPNWSPGSVTLDFADNITFTNNHFFGLAGIAVDALNGVTNSNIVGNAFSDIGEAAVGLGNMNHLTGHIDESGVQHFDGGAGIGEDGISDPPPSDNLDMCISNALGTTWDTSSVAPSKQGSDSARLTVNTYNLVRDVASTGNNLSSPSWETAFSYNKSNTWRSAYNAVTKGEKSWVKLDFQKPYTISKVALVFNPSTVSSDERTNYEILLSNDKFFGEENYVVAATQDTPAKDLQEYEITESGKYRFLMVRTKGATPLAISRVCAFTSDRKAHETFMRCKNIKVNNNYITRTGTELQRSGGIVGQYVENVEIKHNYIYDINYSGVEMGWGWSNERYGTYNVDIDNNLIEHTVKKAMDGGSVYTLSAMPDSSVSRNYVIDTGVAIHALYTDSGSRFISWVDNAAEDQRGGYTPYNDTIIDNVFKGYATHSRNTTAKNAAVNNNITPMEIYTAGQPTRGAYAVMKDAGLEPKYEYLKELPVKGQAIEELEELYDYIHNFDYWSGLTVHYTDASSEALNTVEKGKYGPGLGMYKPEMKPYMEKELSYWNNEVNNMKLKGLLRVKQAMRNVKASMQRYSLSETLNLLDTAISKAESGLAGGGKATDFGLTTKENISAAKKTLENLKARALKINSGEEEYDVLTEAEEAYNSFKAKCSEADIAGVYSDEAVNINIDKDSSEVKLIYPYGTDLSAVSLELFAGLGSEIGTTIGETVNLTSNMTVPVRSTASGNYRYWTISAEIESKTEYTAEGSSFVIPTRYQNRIAPTKNGSVMLRGNPYAYMTDAYSSENGGAEINFIPHMPNDNYEFSVVIGAGNIDSFDVDSKNADSSYYKITFTGTGTSMYAVNGGKETLLSRTTAKVTANSENNLSYKIDKLNGLNHISLKLNGKEIINCNAGSDHSGINAGIYSPKLNIEVLNK